MAVLETLPRAEHSAPRRVGIPRYTLVGPHDAPLIIVLGGISSTRHVVSTSESAGWWSNVVGDNHAVDTTRFRVLGIDFMDGGRNEAGRPRRVVTTHDQARWIARILRVIAVDRVHAIVGASYGGMVALAFAEQFPALVDRLVVFSAAHESHAMSTALRTLQRRIVELGLDTNRGDEAMSIARGLAMTTYRSAVEFAERFGSARIDGGLSARFAVDDYLRNRGDRFAHTMPPERFLALSLSADLHRVDPSRIAVSTILVAADEDSIVPRSQMDALLALLPAERKLIELPTRVGHDAFLVETDRVSSILSSALA